MIIDDIEKALIGKTITDAIVDGFQVVLCLDDGTILNYYASDGGYSSYELTKKGEKQNE